MSSLSMLPSPVNGRVGIRDFTFEACSSFTHVAACQIAARLKRTFVLSTPVENSPLYRSKIPQPSRGGGLQIRLADGTKNPAGEAAAGNAGVQPAKE